VADTVQRCPFVCETRRKKISTKSFLNFHRAVRVVLLETRPVVEERSVRKRKLVNSWIISEISTVVIFVISYLCRFLHDSVLVLKSFAPRKNQFMTISMQSVCKNTKLLISNCGIAHGPKLPHERSVTSSHIALLFLLKLLTHTAYVFRIFTFTCTYTHYGEL